MNEELIRTTLEEYRRRENYWYERAYKSKSGNRAAYIHAASAYSSAVSMLEYALDGNYECLMQFMTEEPE